MCGILGWVDFKRDLSQSVSVVETMSKTLTPRGPDSSGMWWAPYVVLGHRRLVVVDPKGGNQPMVRTRGRNNYVLTYNGELYNTEELRQELLALGHGFLGHSDTEVLLESYIEWGEECLHRLNGIFAFALWDEARQTLFMARDRMGVKPLFYTQRGSSFIFASELKALLNHPEVEPKLDWEGLAEVLMLGPSRTPGQGVFKGILELRPGYCLSFNRLGSRVKRYWALESRPHEDDLATTLETVRGLFVDSVRRQLVSDVPLCTFLSGGLDSSAITAVAASIYKQEGRGPLHTFSVDYKDNHNFFRASEFQPNSDSTWIELISREFDTRHHNIILDSAQLANALTPATLARDLPGMADVDSSLLLFCREVKGYSTVALSGECADEVFGGYPWFRRHETDRANTFPWIRMAEDKLSLFTDNLLDKPKLLGYIQQRYDETISEVPRLPGDSPMEAGMRELFYLNLTWFMTTLLDRKDRMSMATGLEVRVPFCDHRLVEYVWNVPAAMKFLDQREKGLLRRALRGIVPEPVLERRKSPYPKTHNPAYLAAVTKWLKEILNDTNSPLLKIVDKGAVNKLFQQTPAQFDRPWFGQLMTLPQLFAYLIQLDTWLREYKVSI